MRIALRTGGGRGVFELAGRQGDLAASDLFDHEIPYELTPRIIVPGRSVAALRQGKPRIALDDATRDKTTHLYRLLSAVLLLPKPKREFKATHGTDLLRFESYSMTAIKVDVAKLNAGSVVLRPTDLLLENADGQRKELEFTQRMGRVIRLWDVASGHDSELAQLVRNLANAVETENPNYKTIERSAQEISNLLHTTGDPLPIAEEQLGAASAGPEHPPTTVPLPTGEANTFGLEDEISPQEAVIQRVRRWRQQAERGSAGRTFSRKVSNAYDFRCIFSGHRLPRFEMTDAPGVDSAHILPWSTHDLNSVRNGLCLNKQCHWAFDQGILRLDYDTSSHAYVLSIPANIRRAAADAAFDVGSFEFMVGPIPQARLPKNPALWPNPTYLTELNRYLTGV